MSRKRNRKVRGKFGAFVKLIVIAGLFGVGAMILWASSLSIPELDSFEKRIVRQSTKIYDRTGEVLLYDVHENVQRTVIPLSDVSRHIKNATVAIEDAEFYDHKGIKLQAILRAILVNLGALEFSQGGSTITQQVVKNSILTSEKKISRKLKEWILSLRLEQELSKEEILELYLNESPYGGNIYGIEEASEMFFNKSASYLTLSESAYLAALPQAPTFYSPYGNNKNRLEERKSLVLDRMFQNGFITQEEYLLASQETTKFKPQRDIGINAPHFVFFIREYLENKYGKRAVEEKGFKVITTLDFDLQKKAEETIFKFAHENEEKFNAENAGLVAIDPKTGQILVMVGSRDYFDEEIDGNFNVVIDPNRQPGSAFKPFVYATAFNKGYTPETVVFDLKTQFQTTCEPDDLTSEEDCYSPVNYDEVFRGPVTLRNALSQSINVPSVKVLYLAGLRDSLRTAKDMGIKGLSDINRYGLTLVLGGGEVSLLNMVSAYGVFGNKGVRNKPVGILKIEDGSGNVIEEFSQKNERVLPENTALLISDILNDENARAPAFGRHSYLYFDGRDVAVKTGTTNDYRDAWIIGYTPNISVGTWAGNNDNSPMEKKIAGFIVAPMWNAFMREVLLATDDEKFKKPDEIDELKLKPVLKSVWQGGIEYSIDGISGKLASEFTPEETKEEKVLTNIHSILYWVDKENPNGKIPDKPENNPQFRFWEYSVDKWKTEQGFVTENIDEIPREIDDVHKPEFVPKIIIKSPTPNTQYGKNSKITVNIDISGKFPITKVDVFVNDIFIGSSKRSPFSLSFTPNNLDVLEVENRLKIIGYDVVRNRGEAETVFNVSI
ncbi:MAG: PBP1A family penicillin-binding protein [Candidatus Pacebacteria bacterium]|jgi:1A family penicillin-binding protein|nr:PBP1A family penicillin-binding protein [Candidatus Paceibacterota bacterium]|tara:strand:+ start:21227 stop:23737 length:2511 start_codon:yes stop_codon:yes gene_type:complete